MLPEVEAVVGGVDEVGVREHIWVCGERGDERVDELVDGLEGEDARAVELVEVGEPGGVDRGEVRVPAYGAVLADETGGVRTGFRLGRQDRPTWSLLKLGPRGAVRLGKRSW